ncbi:MAG: biotin--[acetyl-CoA-carboxylase] ligase [Burkholderiales bacterium]|nr:biotin--[acetyl-CoA-carboxylase] ligase [Burkholderiales bacterium]
MVPGSPPHLRWEAEALWQQLVPLLPHISVEVLARCESTNSTLIERARQAGGDPDAPVTLPGELEPARENGAPGGIGTTPYGRRGGDTDPCLLVAEQQTRGRGRLGRSWLAAPGASLTFSLVLPLAPRDWSGLSLAVGLALADALDPSGARPEAAAPRIALKWPNDLWLLPPAEGDADSAAAAPQAQPAQPAQSAQPAQPTLPALPAGGAKLGGILVETVSVGRRRLCVVGVGLNVQPLPLTLAVELGAGHACMQALDPQATAPGVLARVAMPLVRALLAFEREGFAPLAAHYAARDLLRGREVTTTLAHAAGGVAEGVDEFGALLLRAAGQRHRIVSGEVSVRRAPVDAPAPAAPEPAPPQAPERAPRPASEDAPRPASEDAPRPARGG